MKGIIFIFIFFSVTIAVAQVFNPPADNCGDLVEGGKPHDRSDGKEPSHPFFPKNDNVPKGCHGVVGDNLDVDSNTGEETIGCQEYRENTSLNIFTVVSTVCGIDSCTVVMNCFDTRIGLASVGEAKCSGPSAVGNLETRQVQCGSQSAQTCIPGGSQS
jgi:hypothetical protein